MPNCVDEVARAKIESHEELCAERYDHITTGIDKIDSKVGGLYNRFWVLAVGIITLLLGIVGKLLLTN